MTRLELVNQPPPLQIGGYLLRLLAVLVANGYRLCPARWGDRLPRGRRACVPGNARSLVRVACSARTYGVSPKAWRGTACSDFIQRSFAEHRGAPPTSRPLIASKGAGQGYRFTDISPGR